MVLFRLQSTCLELMNQGKCGKWREMGVYMKSSASCAGFTRCVRSFGRAGTGGGVENRAGLAPARSGFARRGGTCRIAGPRARGQTKNGHEIFSIMDKLKLGVGKRRASDARYAEHDRRQKLALGQLRLNCLSALIMTSKSKDCSIIPTVLGPLAPRFP